MPRFNQFSILILLFSAAASGCATSRYETRTPTVLTPGPRGLIIAANGAGGYRTLSQSVQDVVTEQGLPYHVTQFDWSHGSGILADQTDIDNICCEGRRLAGEINLFRQNYPNSEVHLMGYSAGCAVALAAAERLPADSINHLILLSPSVSADYDLRPALRTARNGVDVFYSGKDLGYLGVGVAIVGTTDRKFFSAAAGRTGFRPKPSCPQDACLYNRLRQHAWNRCVDWSGNHGGHYGSHKPGYLRAYVLPVLLQP